MYAETHTCTHTEIKHLNCVCLHCAFKKFKLLGEIIDQTKFLQKAFTQASREMINISTF